MAVKKPLVLNNGQIEQLQSSDSLATAESLQLTNNNAGSIVIGTPVYVVAVDAVDKARANATGTKDVFGLVADTTIAAAATGGIQTDGVLTATTGQWDAVAGTTGGLTFNTRYYLSQATAGLLTATAPSSGWVQEVGIALSTTEMKIDIKANVKL
jgi:hypothetical protein